MKEEKTPKSSGGQKQPAGIQNDIYELLHDMVYILAAVTLIFVFVMRMVSVVGPSMTPTLLNGDRLTLLSNTLYSDPKAGDVVVATVPSYNEDEAIVKRVIAVAGQTVDIQYDASGAATVLVDGQVQEEPYINEIMQVASYNTIEFPVTVPEGCLFVMGDNRNHSADSRYPPIGIFDKRYVLGKVLMVVWPGQRDEADKRDFHRLGAVH